MFFLPRRRIVTVHGLLSSPLCEGGLGGIFWIATVTGLLVLSLSAPVSAVGKVKKDIDKICHLCHSSVKKELKDAEVHGHEPLVQGKCIVCHKPHTSKHPGLTTNIERIMCTKCHESVKNSLLTKRGHEPAAKGKCTACHDAHASPLKSLLKIEEPKMCYACHESAKAQFTEKSIHQPVKEGKCLVCHDPHASDVSHGLRQKSPDICRTCHDTAEAAFTTAHKSYRVEKGDCLVCHASHHSRREKLLHNEMHKPVAEGKCSECHKKSSDGSMPLVAPPSKLCSRCHAGIRNELARSVVHKPAREGKCDTCHSSHGANEKNLLKQEEKTLCLSCHEQTKQKLTAKVPHDPFINKKCTTCHGSHGTNAGKLLVKDNMQLCLGCHKQHDHPMDVVPSVNIRIAEGSMVKTHDGKVTCITCHDPHGSDEKYSLYYDWKRQLCIQCHTVGVGP